MHRFRFLLASLPILACLFLAASPASAQAPASPCAADLTDDGVVDAADLGEVLNAWGPCGKSCGADIDGDGVVAGEDMAVVLDAWGVVCPQITGIGPVVGPPFGGNAVTITGTNLGGVTEVRIGGQQANKVVPVDENTVTAIIPPSQPAGSTGPRTVTLVTDSGESSLANGYTYVLLGSGDPPSILSVSPPTVPASGGATVTIIGANFTGAQAVFFDTISAAFTVINDELITATAPAHAKGGMYNVLVVTPGGAYTSVGSIAWWEGPAWPHTVLEAAPDPAVVYDATLRTAILKSGRPWRIAESAVGIEMVLIPPTTFWMGCTVSSDMTYCPGDETPNRWVTLTKAFYLGRYEVTQAQWTARVGSNPSSFYFASSEVPADQVPNRPVEQISWTDIVNDFQPGTGLRLPTEAEWEWACRAGSTRAFHGDPTQPLGFTDVSLVGEIGWYLGNSDNQTHPVGQKPANGFGLHDMSGNVWEWCADWYDDNYYSHGPSIDPAGPSGGGLLGRGSIRGGSFDRSEHWLRSSQRFYGQHTSGSGSREAGFRVARTP